MNVDEAQPDQLQWRQQWSRGSRTWLAHEPWSSQYYLMTEVQHWIWLQLQAGYTAAQIAQQLRTQFADQAVRSEEVAALVSDFQAAGLSQDRHWGSGQARYRSARLKQAVQYHSWWSPWTIRMPLWDPSGWLASLGSVARMVFHPVTAIALSIAVVLMTAHALGVVATGSIDWSQWRQPGVWLGAAICLMVTKSCHELGHALACRRYDVRCHEIGILWLFMLPCLYCDVSDSWRLSSRWQRMVIGLAGVYVECMLAVVAYAAWGWAVPGTFKSVMWLTAVSASLGTLMINANPLLRYDGYFVLSDLIGWPNLWQEATQVWRGWLAKYWGINVRLSVNGWQGLALFAFAFASISYRLLLTGSLLFVIQQIFPMRSVPLVTLTLMAGLIMPWIAGAVATWKTITSGPKQPSLIRWCKRSVALGLLSILAYVLIALPLETKLTARALCKADMIPIYAPASGIVVTLAPDGAWLNPDDQLVELRDFQKELLMQKVQLEYAALKANYERAKEQEVSDTTIAQTLPAVQSVLEGKQEQLQILQTEIERLKVCAQSDLRAEQPCRWSLRIASTASAAVNPQKPTTEVRSKHAGYLVGSAVDRGVLLGHIVTSKPAIVEAFVPEDQMDLLDLNQPVQVCLDSQPETNFTAQAIEILPAAYVHADRRWPSQDGLLPVVERSGKTELAIPHLIVRMQLVESTHSSLDEHWATVLLATRPRTGLERCQRWLRATFGLDHSSELWSAKAKP